MLLGSVTGGRRRAGVRPLSLIGVHILQFIIILFLIAPQRNKNWRTGGAKNKTKNHNIKNNIFFKKIFSFFSKKLLSTNLITVMSLVAGEAGVSGKSGRSRLSSPSSWLGGAPSAAE